MTSSRWLKKSWTGQYHALSQDFEHVSEVLQGHRAFIVKKRDQHAENLIAAGNT